MKTLVLSILIVTMACISRAQDYIGSFEFDGHERKYEVYLPQDFQAKMPLIVSIHGITENVYWYKTYTEMHEVADTLGYVIVYPQGIGNSWNAGMIHPDRYFPDTDDVGFISALIDTMKTKWDIDLSRVYCCGFSLGGIMSFRMAGECGHRLAAIASVSGPLCGLADTWQPIRPMPVLYMHGTRDNHIPYTGQGDRWSAQNTINYWLENNQCTAQADTFSFPNIVPGDGCTIQKISYTSCSGESEVIHYKGINMGHSWPSSQTTFGSEGYKNLDINANIEIMHFFNRFENPLVNMAYSKSLEVYPFNIQTPSDTITVRAEVNNPENHTVDVYAFIHDEQFTFEDSIRLFDDGLHEDGDSSDNIYGNKKLTTGYPEGVYEADLVTYDSTFNISYDHHIPERFIKIGPVSFDNYTFDTDDTIPYPGDDLKIWFTLKNESTTATAVDIKVKLTCPDPLVAVPWYLITTEDIPAGESSVSEVDARIRISEDCPGNTDIPIIMDISSFDHVCWIDTFLFHVYGDTVQDITNPEKIRDSVTRIYPNPTENIINIEMYNIGGRGVEMEIVSLSGQIMFKGVMEGTTYQTDLFKLQKGIYFLTIISEDFVTTRKIIKL